MPTLLIRHADVLVTMDAERREIADGALLARDGVIEQVGPTASLPAAADEVLELTPVPGGVGPMTIAMLLRITLRGAELADLRGE
jgi:5,10-methylene-tetrahydrofolate dehydrogenase/methenyl tetrahydrofolate cyclohydrolase